MHVEGQLSLLLEALLLGRDLVVSLHHHTLGEQLLLSATAADLLKSVLSIIDQTLSESAKTDLNQSSVEQNLAENIEVGDRLLEMRHQHHVTSLVVLAVESKEVDLAKHGSGTNNALTVAEQVVAKNVDQVVGILSLASRGDDGLHRVTNSLPAVLLESLDNLSRLHVGLAMCLNKCRL